MRMGSIPGATGGDRSAESGQAMVNVTAAVLVKDGKLLIAKRKPSQKLANMWELPGGKVEKGETPEDCLVRELKEEFDIEASVGEFLGAHVYHYDFGSIRLMGFRASHDAGEVKLVDHTRVEWVSVDQLADYDFAPADIPFLERMQRGEIQL